MGFWFWTSFVGSSRIPQRPDILSPLAPSGLDVACARFVHIVHCVRHCASYTLCAVCSRLICKPTGWTPCSQPPITLLVNLAALVLPWNTVEDSGPQWNTVEHSGTQWTSGPVDHSGGPGVSLVFVPHWISSDAWPACAAFTGGNKPHLSQTNP